MNLSNEKGEEEIPPRSHCKGNIIDTWTRVTISKYKLIIGCFPHPAWKTTYIPDNNAVDFWLTESAAGRYKTDSRVVAFESIVECRYYEMEDWLANNNSGYFLIQHNILRYELYFELIEDATHFKLTWC